MRCLENNRKEYVKFMSLSAQRVPNKSNVVVVLKGVARYRLVCEVKLMEERDRQDLDMMVVYAVMLPSEIANIECSFSKLEFDYMRFVLT